MARTEDRKQWRDNQQSDGLQRQPDKLPAGKLLYDFAVYSTLLLFLCATFYLFGSMNNISNRTFGFWGVIYYAKTGLECVASIFALFYILVALSYKRNVAAPRTAKVEGEYRKVAVAYFCCDDIDSRALRTVAESCAKFHIKLLVHDDSVSRKCRATVNDTVALLQLAYSIHIEIVRRTERVGGKAGAANNIIKYLSPEIEFLLICDSDSFLPNTDFLEETLPLFCDPNLAVVQFHNVGHTLVEDGLGYRILSLSINFYDAFVYFMDRFGWSPFLGHNALLRISAINEVGGFTPGELADDIDYSVKIRLRGYQIRYARTVSAGERHPISYRALRRRTQKWVYGCTKVLLRWTGPILASGRLSPFEKLSFFLTVGYYHFQILNLAYLTIFYICLPFDDPEMGGKCNLMLSAGMILFFTFLPSISYFARNNRLIEWPRAAVYWGFTYGSQDFVMLGALFRCLFRQKLGWAPTNGRTKDLTVSNVIPELLFGAIVISVAAYKHPSLLLLPTTILFAGKFLISPCLDAWVFGSVRESGATAAKTGEESRFRYGAKQETGLKITLK